MTTFTAPSTPSATRPLVSVMLPTYQPNHYLLDALKSVLSQDMGRNHMQIAVVDDASPSIDVATLIASVAPAGRVEIVRSDRNLGLAGSWNRCIQLARGDVVHILHQDDIVVDDFYKRLLPAFSKKKNIGMAFCRYAIVQDDKRIVRRSHRERWRAGTLKKWLEKISAWQRIQCPSVLVRRSVYEQLGGYRPDLCYALDWEMWVRIAAQYDVWYEPKTLAYYRRHDQNETNRLQEDGKTHRDVLKTIETFKDILPTPTQQRLLSAAYNTFANKALKQLAQLSPDPAQDISKLLDPVDTAIARISTTPHLAKLYRKRSAQLKARWRDSKL